MNRSIAADIGNVHDHACFELGNVGELGIRCDRFGGVGAVTAGDLPQPFAIPHRVLDGRAGRPCRRRGLGDGNGIGRIRVYPRAGPRGSGGDRGAVQVGGSDGVVGGTCQRCAGGDGRICIAAVEGRRADQAVRHCALRRTDLGCPAVLEGVGKYDGLTGLIIARGVGGQCDRQRLAGNRDHRGVDRVRTDRVDHDRRRVCYRAPVQVCLRDGIVQGAVNGFGGVEAFVQIPDRVDGGADRRHADEGDIGRGAVGQVVLDHIDLVFELDDLPDGVVLDGGIEF